MEAEHVQLYKTIDTILWEDWDPIGVNDYGGSDDEYKDYVPKIFELKIQNASTKQIAQELYKYETDNMGLDGNLKNCFEVAYKIVHYII